MIEINKEFTMLTAMHNRYLPAKKINELPDIFIYLT